MRNDMEIDIMEPQINPDERRFVNPNIQHFSEVYQGNSLIKSPQSTQRSQSYAIPATTYETAPLSRRGTRMTQIGRILTDLRASVSSVQSVFHRNPSAFIMPKPCGFSRPKPNGSRLPNNTYALAGHTWTRPPEAQLWVPSTPRTLMPVGIRGQTLQMCDSGRLHPRLISSRKTQEAPAR